MDSPTASQVTKITWNHPDLLDDETRALMVPGGSYFHGMDLRFTQTAEESMAVNRIKAGAIVISASGMCDAGRIKHHLRHNLARRECTIVNIGYQAEVTLGRRLVDGEKRVRMFGEDIAVRASIHTIGGLSAHADRTLC